jgi:serine/threonine-protein kinase
MVDAAKTLGEFTIEAVLGQGGSGIVYDATWGPRKVALKVLHPSLVGTGKERAQFLAEAQRLQQIAHPSVVKVFACGELPDGRPYLAMERLEGETLARVIARGPVHHVLAMSLFAELSSAVSALHAQGLVHRDLKPENVFVVAGKHAVLLDFGIAKEMAAAPSTTTQDGHVRGTPAYMAPERFFGQPAGVATDVYELALVLYAMLAGRLPWDEHADPEARLAPRSLCELAAVPPALDVEIRRALSTRAQNRPPSAMALLEAVQAASGQVPAGAVDVPVMTAQLRPSRDRAATPPKAQDQQTPLAWAPTEAAPGTGKRATKTWPWIAVPVVAVASVVVAVIAGRGGGGASTSAITTTNTNTIAKDAAVVIGSDDPWNGPGATEEPPKALALSEPKLTPETYRAEAAAAVARLPNDTHFVFTAQIGEMRAQDQLSSMLDKAAKQPTVVLLAGALPPCLHAMVSDSEWVAFGSPNLHAPETGTLVLRGRWKRPDIEACLGETVKPHVAQDGAKLFRIGDDFWLDFIDEHTAYVTKHADLEAESVHKLVRHGSGPPAHTRDLVAKLPVDRALAFVIDGENGEDVIAKTLAVPKTSDLYGWVRIEKAGVSLDVAVDTHDAAAAKLAADSMRTQLSEVFGKSNEAMVGKLEVATDKTVTRVRGTLTSLTLGLISSALGQ